VLGPEGEVFFDLAGRAFGRGAWVHARPECLALAARGGIDRAFKQSVGVKPAALDHAFKVAAFRRAYGLIGAARRAQKLESGSTAVEQAVARGRAELVIVATDARAAAAHAFIEPLVRTGRARAFGTKGEFAACLSRPETALLAVTDARFAREIRQAIEWTLLPEPNQSSGRAARAISSEAG
jgi:ribosomal protein L7Ae-like RNA K-turn-binding protein